MPSPIEVCCTNQFFFSLSDFKSWFNEICLSENVSFFWKFSVTLMNCNGYEIWLFSSLKSLDSGNREFYFDNFN